MSDNKLKQSNSASSRAASIVKKRYKQKDMIKCNGPTKQTKLTTFFSSPSTDSVTEIKGLTDSLTAFFTPTTSGRRHGTASPEKVDGASSAEKSDEKGKKSAKRRSHQHSQLEGLFDSLSTYFSASTSHRLRRPAVYPSPSPPPPPAAVGSSASRKRTFASPTPKQRHVRSTKRPSRDAEIKKEPKEKTPPPRPFSPPKLESSPEVTEADRNMFHKVRTVAAEKVDCVDVLDEKTRCPSRIRLGKFEVDTWFSAPYPQEYARLPMLYICEFCLKYMKSDQLAQKHATKCDYRCPPASEIYRHNDVSVFEVDGNASKIYCQNLCLLAKLFLDHKTLYYDVEPFLFYVATVNDAQGQHFVGYFSKEKYSAQRYNLSCIVTLPCYQNRGFGRFLIDFSFLLSRKEGVAGTPERPLSNLGKISYVSYWKSAILEHFLKVKNQKGKPKKINIKSVSKATGISPHDVSDVLQALRVLIRKEGRFVLNVDWRLVNEHCQKSAKDNRRIWLDESKLKWQPNAFVSPTSRNRRGFTPASPSPVAQPRLNIRSPVSVAVIQDHLKSTRKKDAADVSRQLKLVPSTGKSKTATLREKRVMPREQKAADDQLNHMKRASRKRASQPAASKQPPRKRRRVVRRRRTDSCSDEEDEVKSLASSSAAASSTSSETSVVDDEDDEDDEKFSDSVDVKEDRKSPKSPSDSESACTSANRRNSNAQSASAVSWEKQSAASSSSAPSSRLQQQHQSSQDEKCEASVVQGAHATLEEKIVEEEDEAIETKDEQIRLDSASNVDNEVVEKQEAVEEHIGQTEIVEDDDDEGSTTSSNDLPPTLQLAEEGERLKIKAADEHEGVSNSGESLAADVVEAPEVQVTDDSNSVSPPPLSPMFGGQTEEVVVESTQTNLCPFPHSSEADAAPPVVSTTEIASSGVLADSDSTAKRLTPETKITREEDSNPLVNVGFGDESETEIPTADLPAPKAPVMVSLLDDTGELSRHATDKAQQQQEQQLQRSTCGNNASSSTGAAIEKPATGMVVLQPLVADAIVKGQSCEHKEKGQQSQSQRMQQQQRTKSFEVYNGNSVPRSMPICFGPSPAAAESMSSSGFNFVAPSRISAGGLTTAHEQHVAKNSSSSSSASSSTPSKSRSAKPKSSASVVESTPAVAAVDNNKWLSHQSLPSFQPPVTPYHQPAPVPSFYSNGYGGWGAAAGPYISGQGATGSAAWNGTKYSAGVADYSAYSAGGYPGFPTAAGQSASAAHSGGTNQMIAGGPMGQQLMSPSTTAMMSAAAAASFPHQQPASAGGTYGSYCYNTWLQQAMSMSMRGNQY